MVIYLEEAVARRRGASGRDLTRAELREAVVDGALLRLRPKLMTVSTVIAGLLPIMWSDRVGAEVMKPLATPVLGGMVSSLLHVLVVTPVLFYWIHERKAVAGIRDSGLGIGEARRSELPIPNPQSPIPIIAVTGLIAALGVGWFIYARQATEDSSRVVIETVRSGDVSITLSNPSGRLQLGTTLFTLEFRSSATNELIDVGDVQVGASMSMPGMTMSADIEVEGTGQAGVYRATGQFAHAGAWRMEIAWSGPAGQGSAIVEGDVQ
jgi:Cu(I)/Ag(I) efflux system membrane protein CusA/SilA